MLNAEKNAEKLSQTLEIRSGVPDDAVMLANLYKETWLATYPNVEYGITQKDIEEKVKDWDSEENVNQWKERLNTNNPNTLQIVAVCNGEVVGHSRLHKRDDGPNKLQTIYVLPNFHGMGVAASLAKQGLAWLGNDKDVALEVAKYNERAIHFYEKLGFVITGDAESPAASLPSGRTIPEFQMLRKAKSTDV